MWHRLSNSTYEKVLQATLSSDHALFHRTLKSWHEQLYDVAKFTKLAEDEVRLSLICLTSSVSFSLISDLPGVVV